MRFKKVKRRKIGFKKKKFMCKNLKVFSSFSSVFPNSDRTIFFVIQGRYFNFFKNKELYLFFSRFNFNFFFYRNVVFSSYLSIIENFFGFFKFPTLIVQAIFSFSELNEKKMKDFFIEMEFKKMFVIGFFTNEYFVSISNFFTLSNFFFRINCLFNSLTVLFLNILRCFRILNISIYFRVFFFICEVLNFKFINDKKFLCED